MGGQRLQLVRALVPATHRADTANPPFVSTPLDVCVALVAPVLLSGAAHTLRFTVQGLGLKV